MKGLLKRSAFPLAVVCAFALQTVGMDLRRIVPPRTEAAVRPDTILYQNPFGRVRHDQQDTASFQLQPLDTVPRLTARDTIQAPDSLRETDPFRYKYYVATFDSLTHRIVVDSLRHAGDTVDWPVLDSIYYADSAARKKAAFEAWYAALDKAARKKYDLEVKEKAKKRVADSIQVIRDSVQSIRDSIRENTPRILETFALEDSMQYKRIIQWTHERELQKMDVQIPDTSYNYRFHDYPFRRRDVNATWLGVPGSALQTYDFLKRGSENGVSFYTPYESWTYSPSTLPLYNTKTPYTELAYFGTLFAKPQKESDNLHILTTQNLWPEFNFTLSYDRFGGGGMMENEETTNKTFVASANYLGKNYLMHFGYIYNMVRQGENGGMSDLTMVRDTTLDARDYPVYLSDASTQIKKNTFFLDQQIRLPLTFLLPAGRFAEERAKEQAQLDSLRNSPKAAGQVKQLEAEIAEREKERAAKDSASLAHLPAVFVGHSSEFSVFRRLYEDQVTPQNAPAADLLGGHFYYNSAGTADSLRVAKLENRLFVKLKPWADDAIVSRVGGGLGNRILTYYDFDPTFLHADMRTVWNSSFVYGGAEGSLSKFFRWDALGEYTFLGDQANDLRLSTNARLNVYPFRKHRTSPVRLDLHFKTSLLEPDHYQQHFHSNHYRWDNDFGKISDTRLQASLSVPHWNVAIEGGYALLGGNLYYGADGIIRQNGSPISVASLTLTKNFTLLRALHLDHRILLQATSDQQVIPVPDAAASLRYYLQFNVKKNAMQMQLGAHAWCNTAYYSPAWNPAVGAFVNQQEEAYYNGPVIDAFLNIQWKRACIFVKLENVGQGWPVDKKDYFSAHRHIGTQRALKLGLYWPFYKQPNVNNAVKAGGGLSGGGSRGGGGLSRGMGGNFGGF